MYSKITILTFPPEISQKALVCQLTKKYDLLFNILSAKISNKKEGYMVLEISSASKTGFNKGIKFLKDQGVSISSPEHQIYKDEEVCTHCGACTAVCPTEALYIKRPEMEIIFDKEKCSVCELCVVTCPTRAMGLFASKSQQVIG
ncbi:MAG: 4Fe-4S binding protein [Desulfobacula sp.]|uniref:4Fe-4S dicluster domain-containing protein n=1 Tax=Desulfobacula sp. TaxID=2593537 RepID=UPI001DCC71D0|nr:4Fe-4S binding protein [Desulfobacula sp.]MBT3484691.1 4Fe-4S binding protein [Desulfobacula sp.]MBT3805811.1 4Fe-4S binding protein [Desulfobacula sp.]MBT4026205.1 4Fe-4S binding protein [Desulfobacula sp.]MBT4200034.1 4Fe-4S binding protein [Desulfobacula sp.]